MVYFKIIKNFKLLENDSFVKQLIRECCKKNSKKVFKN